MAATHEAADVNYQRLSEGSHNHGGNIVHDMYLDIAFNVLAYVLPKPLYS